MTLPPKVVQVVMFKSISKTLVMTRHFAVPKLMKTRAFDK